MQFVHLHPHLELLDSSPAPNLNFMMPSKIDKVKDLSTLNCMNIVNIAGIVPSTSRGDTQLVYRGHDSWEKVNIMAPVFPASPIELAIRCFLRTEIISVAS